MWRGGLGGAYLLPALSSAGASLAPPCFRFHTPLIEPDGPVSGEVMGTGSIHRQNVQITRGLLADGR